MRTCAHRPYPVVNVIADDVNDVTGAAFVQAERKMERSRARYARKEEDDQRRDAQAALREQNELLIRLDGLHEVAAETLPS